jgi:hypothetical protein
VKFPGWVGRLRGPGRLPVAASLATTWPARSPHERSDMRGPPRMSLRSSRLRHNDEFQCSRGAHGVRVMHDSCPSMQRAQGMPGAAARTHSLAWQMEERKPHEHTTGKPRHRHSLRNGLRLIARSPRCPGFLATVALRIITTRLDPSVGRSGPHAFAVRIRAARLATLTRPSLPAANVRGDCATPL